MHSNSRDNTASTSVLVLGGSSWLGYLLIEALGQRGNYDIHASYHRQQLTYSGTVELFQAKDVSDYQKKLKEIQPEVVVNFLRGEDANGLAIHRTIIAYCEANAGHYLYASSALALDAYADTPLTEDLLAKSNSAYGQFKANCEQLLYDTNICWTILRFASVQGWVPHKLTRNEAFLQKMKAATPVQVDQGVWQNRMSANLLVSGIVSLIEEKIAGILHFGTTDASEEHLYLKRVASAFGYDPRLVEEGKLRKVNLVTVPDRIFKVLSADFKVTEQDTLDELLSVPALQTYHRKFIK